MTETNVRTFESEIDSPDHKRTKVSLNTESPLVKDPDVGCVVNVNNMAAPMPMAKTKLNFSEAVHTTPASSQAPIWFTNYEKRLDDKFNILFTQISECNQKLKLHDDKIDSIEFKCESLKSELKLLHLENQKLVEKVDDLENRGRRKNLIIFGIAEGAPAGADTNSGSTDCMKTVKEFLSFAGVKEDLLAIERAHRTPTYRDPRWLCDHNFATLFTRFNV